MSFAGIDIGSKTIKIVEIEKEGNAFKLKGSGVVGYQGITPDRARDEKELVALAEAIKKLHKEANISTRDIGLSIPEPLVFTRTIKFPLLTDQEIASAVKWEAEQYIPIPIADAVIQHQIIERKESAVPPEVSVLLVAVPRDLVSMYVKVIQMANLNVTFVETELIALARAIAPVDQTVLIVDFGARSTDLGIAKNGQLVFSRTIPTAGEAFTRAVAQTLGIQLNQAEEYKRAYGLSGSQLEGKIRGALDPVFRLVVDEMKKAIHFYQSEEKGDEPKAVIISGGTSGMPEAIPLLTKLINYEVVVGNPFAKIALEPEAAKNILPYAPLYAIAAGLALRGE